MATCFLLCALLIISTDCFGSNIFILSSVGLKMGSGHYTSAGMCCKAVFRYEFEESREVMRNII
jgi:hypothetical protein